MIIVSTADGSEREAEAQYGCYNFTYHDTVSSPVTAYRNKWPSNWFSHWFYHKIELDEATKSHSLICDPIRNLGQTPRVNVGETHGHLTLISMIREVLKVYGTRDLVEE